MTIGTVYMSLRKVLSVQGKPGGSVHISNGMPDVEALMQQWPIEVEQKLHITKLPDSTLVTLVHFFVVCARVHVCVCVCV